MIDMIKRINMCLHRRYMEKYRLIEKATVNGRGSAKDESSEESCTSRDSSSLGMIYSCDEF